MDQEFYISLPESSKDQSVVALILHTLSSIDLKGVAEQDVGVEHFYLVNPYISEDRPSAYIKYAPLDKGEIKRRNNNLKLREKYNDSDVEPPIVFAEEHHAGMHINSLVQRLPVHDEQGNAIRLLRETAATLERLGNIEVKDLILHNFLDDDGLEHPYISVYYSS
jgi:hypothetical protein